VELTGFIPIIRRWLGVILLATVVATGVGLLLGASAEKTYEARAELLVGPLSTDTDTMRASGDLGQTYAELATTGGVLRQAAEDLDLSTGELRTGVRATANSTTRFLVVRARSHSATDAAGIANAISLQLLELGKQDPTRPEGQLRVIDSARVPLEPMSPRLDLIVPLAALAGLLGSITLVLLFEFVGDTAESVEKVDALTGVATLTVKRRRELSGADLAGELEPYRMIATHVDLAAQSVRCVLITGVTDDDGTSGLAKRLAAVWARRRETVAIFDASTGELSELVGPGDLVRAGRSLDSEPEAITLEDAAALRDRVAVDGGLLVVYGQPSTVSAATLVWARIADATVLSVRRFQARRSMISDAVANLAAVDANLALSVLHERPGPVRRAWSGRDGKARSDDVETTAASVLGGADRSPLPKPAQSPRPAADGIDLAAASGSRRSGSGMPR